MRLKALCLCCMLVCLAAHGQSRKSVRAYNAAMGYEGKRNYVKAEEKLKRAIKKSPRSATAYSQLGQLYFEEHQFTAAAATFRTAAKKCRDGRKAFALPLAKSLGYCGITDSAMRLINMFTDHKPDGAWERLRVQAAFVKRAYLMQLTQQPVNLGIRVNTDYPELYPLIVTDTDDLYFTRRVNGEDDDLYYAPADSCGGWFYAQNMGDPPNSPDQESAQFISDDGHYLFFTRCENRSEDGWAEGGCDLFIAYRVKKDTDWTIGQPFGATINTTDYEGMPSLSPDNRELYFVSDRPGGCGGYDIWISRFEDGLWQPPVNAGPGVNTAGNETAPFIGRDNKTLYFTSDGWPGMGGTDLFVSKRNTCKPATDSMAGWGSAVNLGYPVNTAYDEKSECVTADGKSIYFASDRSGPAGNYDLYSAQLVPGTQPLATTTIDGYVYDSLTKLRLSNANIYVRNVATGDSLYEFQSNRGDGSYTMVLPAGAKYAIHTFRVEYKETDDTIDLGGIPTVQNIKMLPSDYIPPPNDTMVLTLHFDVNRVELSDSDVAAIKAALAPWTDRDGVSVFVNAYTDNTGSPMINEELSYKRADIVAEAVEKIGIGKASIQSKGWGEAKMIATNDTEDGRKMNRRVEITVRY